MITVTMYLSAGEFCKGFTIKGHADSYVGDSQYDLVCAAVSAVTLTCALGLRDILGKQGTYDSENGFMSVNIADKADEQSELLVKTMLQGLKMIQEKYPDIDVTLTTGTPVLACYLGPGLVGIIFESA